MGFYYFKILFFKNDVYVLGSMHTCVGVPGDASI